MAEKLVTLTSNGITMTVPAGEVSIYTRAGYVVVEPEPVKPVEVQEPELSASAELVAPVEEPEPEPVAPVEEIDSEAQQEPELEPEPEPVKPARAPKK